MDGVAYTWDANGNLLWDGTNNYTYDHANRLETVSGSGHSISYMYNGLGERLRQGVDGVTTDYTVDLNAGLSQVLMDDTYAYVYGLSRLAQHQVSGVEYFLTDALGSVRQLVDANGTITLMQDYRPYGEVLATQGSGETIYGYTNEYTSQGLIYLRARWYAPYLNQTIPLPFGE